MSKRLVGQDYRDAAESLGVDEASIRALVEVESDGSGFMEDGSPKVLFEDYVFYRELRKAGVDADAVVARNPDLCCKRYRDVKIRGPRTEKAQLERAISIHEGAALRSASWGLFQLMGFNFAAAGFSSVQDFAEAMRTGEREQLMAACNFIRNSKGMLRALRSHDWATFARLYNGADYRSHNYDTRLRAAWLKNGGKG